MEPSLGHLQVCCLLSPWVFLLVLGGQALSRGMSLGLVELFPQQRGHSILSNCSSLFCSDLCCIIGCVCVGVLLLPQGEALPMCCFAHGSLCLWVFDCEVPLPPSVSLRLQGINFLFCVPGTQQVPPFPLCSSLSLLVSVLESQPQQRVSCSQPAHLTSVEPEAQRLWPGLLPGPSAMTLCLPLASHCLPVPSCALQVPVFSLLFVFSLFVFKEAVPLSLVVPVF